MSATTPSRTGSAGGTPASMPTRLWEMAKHGSRGTIPRWVHAAPDAGATAPARIGQIARRAAQAAAAAGVVAGGIGVGIGATDVASRPVDLAHRGHGAPGEYHTGTDHGTGSPASSDSGAAPGPPGSASEGEVTLHTSGDGGHLATGLATTWRIPGHGAAGGEHGEAGVEGGHDGLTVEMYQDVVVQEGADGMFSVDAVEYVVVRDEHGHTYVFRENYHTVVPDSPGQETDLVVHETDRAQVVEHPDGSFSVTQADNSISVTVGSDGEGQHEVTVTQTESVQIGHDPHADGHDTVSLTENEYGATTSDQTEVVTEQTLFPNAGTHQPSASMPQPSGQEPGRPAHAEVPGGPPTRAEETSGQRDDGLVYGTAGSTTWSTASMAASSQVGTAQPTPPDTFSAARVMATPPPLATSLGVAATTADGLTSGHEPHRLSAFAGPRGGLAGPGRGAGPAGHAGDEPVPALYRAGGVSGSVSGPAAAGSSGHLAAGRPAGGPGPDPDHGAGPAGHDQPGPEEPGGSAGVDLAPAGAGAGAGEHEATGGADPGLAAGWAHAAGGHDPGVLAGH